LNVPLYLLGSSDFSARLAAELGLPFASRRTSRPIISMRRSTSTGGISSRHRNSPGPTSSSA